MEEKVVLGNMSVRNIGQFNQNNGSGTINATQINNDSGVNVQELIQAIAEILNKVRESNLSEGEKENIIYDIRQAQDEIQEEEPRKSKIEKAIATMNNIGRLAEAGTMMVGNVAGFVAKISLVIAGMGALL